MSDLTHIERIKLEKLFNMQGGYVLDFSNRTITDFIYESVQKNIYDQVYEEKGDSKANRLRTFWAKEPNHVVATLLSAMLEYYTQTIIASVGWDRESEELFKTAEKIAERLKGELGEHVSEIEIDHKDFGRLGKSVRQLINENKPEEALDRLHTYFAMFIRQLCDKHGIQADSNKPIHSLFGEYIKQLQNKGHIESIMGERILKYSISLIDAFNDVRNNKSLAHPNSILGYEESLLIFRTISSVIGFINSLERKIESSVKTKEAEVDTDFDLPF